MKKKGGRCPLGPRQPGLPLEHAVLVRWEPKERAKAIAILAQLLMEASDRVRKEGGDEDA